MSSVDNRIVQMQFENSQFEKGVKESLKSIEELEKSLEFKDAEKGLAALQKAGDSFSLAKMAEGIEKIEQRFSVMGVVGKRIIENITDSAVRMGEQFIKSITTDQVSAGWDKYAKKTEAVQTIIAATGKDIDYVEGQLEKLNWFTDETSYDFVDMTSNIGKFTSMGIDLETSVTAMQGIATWAAVSGQNVATASRAMYNMSQAIGVGSVKLMDWKSIENANMATKEFKQTAIETAKALGKLNAQGKTAKGTAVTYENFSQTLSEGWFTKDVLLKTLDKYGEYANKVYEIATEKGIPASEAMELITDDTMELGKKAFKAAQEAKTFADAIGSVKDAVSTGWMNIFQDLFGNYEEAKTLWTDLANYLWDMFAAPLSDTHELLAEWSKLGGRSEALEGIYNIFEGIANIVATVKDAIRTVFPETTVEQLLDLSRGVKEFGENFKNTFSRTEREEATTVKRETELDKIMQIINSGLGDRIGNIRLLQEELVKLGYLSEDDFVSGLLGPSTLKAFEDFQNGIKKTQTVLETELKFGDKGKEVEEFQKKLLDLGFDPGGIDGIWGKKTQKAYDNYIASLNGTEKAYRQLKKGMRDEDVRDLQLKLIEAGHLDAGQADGIFGPKTEAALKEWQKAHKLTQSGILDKKTFDSMFPKEAEEAGDSIEYETETIIDYSDRLQNLFYITEGGASAIHILTSFFGFLGKVVGHVGKLMSPLVDAFIAIGAAVANSITAFDKWLQETGVFDQWFENVKKFLEPFGKWVENASKGLLSFFGLTNDASESADKMMTFPQLYENIKNSIKKTGIIDKVTGAWKKLKGAFDKVIPTIKTAWKTVKDSIGTKLRNLLGALPEKIASVTEWLGNLASKGLEKVSGWIQKIPGAIDKIKGFWAALTQKGDPESGKAPGFLTRVKEGFQSVIDYLFGEGDISNGKKPGLFRKIGQLLSGDLDGFTEGMNDETKQQVLDKIQAVKDFIQKVREAIIVLFGGELGDDKKISDETIKKINNFKDSIASVFEGIALLFTGKVQKNSKLSGKTRRTIRNIRKTIIGIIELIGKTLSDIWHTIIGIFTGEVTFESVGDFFSSFWESVKQFFIDASGVASVNLGSTWVQISNFFSGLWENIKNIGKWLLIGYAVYKVGSFIGNISGAFYKLKEVIGSYKRNTQALSKSVLQFAEAIALIAGSIWLVGQLDSDQFTRGAAAVGGIVVAIIVLLGACALLSTTLGKGVMKTFKQLGDAIFEIGIGIGVIALAIALLGVLPQEVFENGLSKLVGIMIILGAFLWALSTVGGTNIKLKGFWQIAVVIAVMAYIAVKLSKVPIDQLTDGIIALGAIMGLLAGFVWVMGKVGANKIKMKGFIGLAVAVGILAIVAVALGNIEDQGKLWRGIGAVAAIMAMIAGIAFIMGKWGKDIKPMSMLLLFGGIIAVMLVFNYIIQQIKDVDPAILYAFSISLALALGAFVGACMIVGKIDGGPSAMLKGAASIGGALVILASIIGGMVYGLGELDKLANGGIIESIERGGDVLSALATVLEPFIDGLEDAIIIVGFLIASEVVGQIPGGPKAMLTGALSISLTLGILTSALVILVGGLGKLEEIENLNVKASIEKGGEILGALATAIDPFTKDLDNFTIIAGFLAASEIIGLIPGGPGAMITGALSISLALGILVAASALLVGGLGKLNEISDNKVVEAIEEGGEVLSALGGAIYGLIGGFNQAFQNDIKGFGDAVSSVAKDVKGMSEDGTLDADLQVALDVAEKIHGFFSDLVAYTPDIDGFGQYKSAANQLSIDMGEFGTAIGDLRDGITGIASEENINLDVDASIGVASKLKSFFDDISLQTPSGKGLIDYNFAVSGILTHVSEFSTALGSFHKNISGFNSPGIEDDTSAAISAATAVADFLVDLKVQSDKIEHNRSAIHAFFAGDTTQKTVFDAIESLGTSVQSARQNIKGIGGGTFEADLASAMTALSKIVGILAYLKENEVTDIYTTGDFDSLLMLFDNIADKIVEFNTTLTTNNVSENVTTSIATIMGSIGELVSALSGSGPNKLSTENFLSGLDLESVTTKLDEFSGYLGTALDGVVTDISDHKDSFSNAGIDLAGSISAGLSEGDLTIGLGILVLKALTTLDGYKKSFFTSGGNFTVGLANGVAFNAYLAVKAAASVAQKMAQAVNNALGIRSPSRVAAEAGGYFTEGLAKGTTDKVGEATSAAEKVANSMLTSATGTLATLSGLLADDIDVNPVIAPVVDLTNARQSAAMIGGLFGNPSIGVTSSVLAKDAMVSTNNGRPITIQNGTMSTTESLGSVTEQLNALTSYLTARNDGPHVSEMESLTEKFGDLAEAVTGLKIVLDTGTLVGELTPALDTGLGNYAAMRDRGN